MSSSSIHSPSSAPCMSNTESPAYCVPACLEFHNQQYLTRKQQSSLFLVALLGMLSTATVLAYLFVPRDEHSPRMLMHPLSSIKHSRPQQEDSIRYLTFGSSSTWGEGLSEPSQEAFPWLISPSVHNVAARVGGISLSAICTQSIVGDGIYDVVVIEFMDTDAEGVVQLARRIRQRFPNAQIIFVRLWSPVTHVVYDDSLLLLDWWKQQPKQQLPVGAEHEQLASVLNSFEFQAALLNSDPHRWSFADFTQQAAVVNDVIHEVKGQLFELPSPNGFKDPLPVSLTSPTYTVLFQDARPQLLSAAGHQIVAHGIQQLVSENKIYDSDRSHVGSWGTGDACALWYGTGDYSALRTRRRASLVDFSRESDGFHRHAVEISRRGGSIEVVNPFDEPRMLYLTYMTAAASPTGTRREYPRTKVSVGGKALVLIDPVHNNERQSSGHHLTRTTAVGVVPPGKSVVKLDSLDSNSVNRFRLVGHHFLAKGKVPVPFEYDLEPDAAHR